MIQKAEKDAARQRELELKKKHDYANDLKGEIE